MSGTKQKQSSEGMHCGAFKRIKVGKYNRSLPPSNTKRWVIRRKAEVVAGVRAGLLSLQEACDRYDLSVEEFLSWQRMIERHGMLGLRTTRLQDYRPGQE